MVTIVTRSGKGSPLTNNEVDANFTNLNSGKLELSGGTLTGAVTVSGSTSTDLVRITQTGTGNSLVVEDSTNPDSTPFVVDTSGNVGIGVSAPSAKVDIGSGNIAFTGSAQRITGDFSNATIANRVMFQTSTTNGATGIVAIPNGTGTSSTFIVTNSSDVANTSYGQINISTTLGFQLQSSITGTGTNLPMTFYTAGSERVRIDTSGNIGVGITSPASKLDVNGAIRDSKGDVRTIVQNAQTAAYVLVAADAGKHISITTGGVTINSGIFSAGDAISIYNNSAASQTITQGTSVTMYLGGTATTGNRTLAQRGICTILCVASNTFVISGAGLT